MSRRPHYRVYVIELARDNRRVLQMCDDARHKAWIESRHPFADLDAELTEFTRHADHFVALLRPDGGIAARFVVLDEDDPEALFDVDVDIAMSHGIEPDAMDVFKRRDDEAVRLRAGRLEREAEAFFSDRIQAQDHDRVSIAEIVRRVDMGTP